MVEKFMQGKCLSDKKISMEAKENFGDGCGSNYTDSRSENSQDAISRVSAVR